MISSFQSIGLEMGEHNSIKDRNIKHIVKTSHVHDLYIYIDQYYQWSISPNQYEKTTAVI